MAYHRCPRQFCVGCGLSRQPVLGRVGQPTSRKNSTPVFRSQTAMFRPKNQQKKKPGNKHGQIHLCCCSRVTEQISKWECKIHQRLNWPNLSKINNTQPDSAPRSTHVLNLQCARTAVCHPYFYPVRNSIGTIERRPTISG